MDIKTLRTKSVEEIQTELKDLFREQFNLRMQKNLAKPKSSASCKTS